jgi:hypothetical protein
VSFPINAFQPADWKVKASDSSSKSPFTMPHVSVVGTEVDEDDEDDEDDEAEDELEVKGNETGSVQATRNNEVNDEKPSNLFLFI